MNNHTSTLSKHVSWRHQIIIALVVFLSSMPLALAGNCGSAGVVAEMTPENRIVAWSLSPDYLRLERDATFRMFRASLRRSRYRTQSIEFTPSHQVLFHYTRRQTAMNRPLFAMRLAHENPELNIELFWRRLDDVVNRSGGIWASISYTETAMSLSQAVAQNPGAHTHFVMVIDPAVIRENDHVAGMNSLALDTSSFAFFHDARWIPSNLPPWNILGKVDGDGNFVPNPSYGGSKTRADIEAMYVHDEAYGLSITITFPDGYE